VIVRAWRLKFEFSPGKFRNLPLYDQAPASLSTFLERAVASGTANLMIHVQTEDLFVDPSPAVVVTFLNFDHFSNVPFAPIPAGGGGGAPAGQAAFYFNPAVAPDVMTSELMERVTCARLI
jgi:hypothetical protein